LETEDPIGEQSESRQPVEDEQTAAAAGTRVGFMERWKAVGKGRVQRKGSLFRRKESAG
jgi:hypothetical protein